MNIFFFSNLRDRRQFSLKGFMRTDILILRQLGNRVSLIQNIFVYFLFWKYDVAFIYFYRLGFIPAMIAKLFHKKVIFTGGIDDLDPKYTNSNRYNIQKILFFICNYFSDCNIIVSNADCNNISKIGLQVYTEKKFVKSSHVIDVGMFKCHEFAEKKLIFSTVAWMDRVENIDRKGVDLSIHVFNELIKNEKFKDAKFVIVGTIGEGGLTISKLISQLNLDGKVFMTDLVSEIKKVEILKESMFYLQLSKYEGFGIAALEALCAGNIVIHSGNGGLEEVMANYGLKVDIKVLPHEIAKQIIENIDTCFLSRSDAVNYVLDNYSFDVRSKLISNVLYNLTN